MEQRKTELKGDLKSLRIKRDQTFSHAPRSSVRKWLLGLALVILLGAIGVLIASRLNLRSRLGLDSTAVHVAAARRQGQSGAQPLLSASGYIIARNRVEVGSKITGRVVSLEVKEGDFVHQGQVVARLDDSEVAAQLRGAQAKVATGKASLAEVEAGSRPQEIQRDQAEVERVGADLKNAEINLHRTEDLIKGGVIAQQELDNARSRYEMALATSRAAKKSYEITRVGPRPEAIAIVRATLREAMAEVSVVQADMENTIIRAPMSGTVLDRYVSVGEMVTTGYTSARGAKQALLSIADLTDLLVEIDISETDIAKVRLQQPATIVPDAYPDKRYQGIAEYIASTADRQKATVQVKVRVLSPDQYLRPDLGAKLTFYQVGTKVSGGEDIVLVPKSALVSQDGHTFIFIARDQKAVRQPVTVGLEAGSEIQILAGLQGGEDVIVDAKVKDGDKISLLR